MKKMRKLLSALLAVAIMLSVSTAAFAVAPPKDTPDYSQVPFSVTGRLEINKDDVTEDGFIAATYTSGKGTTMPVRFRVPTNYDSTKTYPAVLNLHGGSGRGDDGISHVKSVMGLFKYFIASEDTYPAFLVAPQAPLNATFDAKYSEDWGRLAAEATYALSNYYNINRSEVYLIGHSMGGCGAWLMLAGMPGVFKATVMGASRYLGDLAVMIPYFRGYDMLMFHGTADTMLDIKTARILGNCLNTEEGFPYTRYFELEGVGHTVNPAFDTDRNENGISDVVEWLFAEDKAGFGFDLEWVNPFTDISKDDAYYRAIEFVYRGEIATGTSDTTFSPDAELNRATLATMGRRYAGNPTSKNGLCSDVKETDWYRLAADWVTHFELLEVYEDGKFHPTNKVTVAELVSYMYAYSAYKGLDVAKTSDYTNAALEGEALAAMKWAVGHGIIDSSVDVTAVATRADAATILFQFDNIVAK